MVNLGSAYGEVIIGTGDGEKAIKSLASTLRGMGTNLSLAISAPLVGVAAAGLKAAAGFEQSMNMLQVATGATEQAMQSLQSKALQLGAETSFSAGEAAEAMLELAKAGMSAEQTMAAIGGVMELAAAGNVGLAQAATITAAALNAFHLPAQEAANVANLLAAAANASAADITDLAQGLQQGGFAFGAAGQQVDDLVASLAILTNVGLTGSDAGTALKNAMMRLMNPTKKAAELMDELGINAYDAQGNMLPFADVIDEINQGTKDMTQEQRNAALSTIFLSDGMKAFIPLLDAGKDGFLKMKEEVNAEGAAAEMANARMKGLAGAIEYIKGSIESVLIEVALPFLDFLSQTIRRVADAITGFTKLPAPLRNAVLAFLGVLAAIGPVVLALGTLGSVLGAILSPIGLIGLALAGLAAAWVSNFGGIQEKTAAAWAAVQPYLTAMRTWLQSNIPVALTYLQGIWNTYWPQIQSVVASAWSATMTTFQSMRAWLQNNIPTAIDTLLSAFNSLREYFTAVVDDGDYLNDWLTHLPEAIRPVVQALGWMTATAMMLRDRWLVAWSAIQERVAAAWAAVQPHLAAMRTWLQVNIPAAISWLRSMWSAFWTNLPGMVATAWSVTVTTLQNIYRWFTVDLPAAITILRAWWAATWADIQNRVAAAWGMIQPPLMAIWRWLSVNIPAALTYLQGIWNTYWPAIQERVAAAWAAVQPALSDLWGWLMVNLPMAVTWLRSTWTAFWTNLPTTVSNAWATIQETFTTIKQWVSTDIPDALTTMQGKWDSTWARIMGVVGMVRSSMTSLWGTLTMLFGPAIDNLTSSFNKMTEDFSKLGPRFGELGTAVTNVAGAIGRVLMVLGAGIAVVVYAIAIVAINLLAATFQNLGFIVDSVVEGITLTLNGIASILTGLIGVIQGIVTGDWQLVWQSLGDIAKGVVQVLAGVGAAARGIVVGMARIIYDTLVGTLKSVGVDVDAALSGIKTWFVETLPASLNSLKNDFYNRWNQIKSAVVDRVQPIIDVFSNMKEWLEVTLQNAFTSFKDFMATFTFSNPFTALSGWIDGIVNNVQWLIDNIPGVGGGASGVSGASASGNAVQASGLSAAGAGMAGGMGGMNITINVSGMNGEMDWNRAARRLAREIVGAAR